MSTTEAVEDVTDDVDEVFLKVLAEAMQREPAGDLINKCRPHGESCGATGWSVGEFNERLRSNSAFRKRYTSIMGPPPPLEQLTELWVMTIDSHIHNAKQGHAGSIQFLLKHLDKRFKPPRTGRPTKKVITAEKLAEVSAAERARTAKAMYASLLSGEELGLQ